MRRQPTHTKSECTWSLTIDLNHLHLQGTFVKLLLAIYTLARLPLSASLPFSSVSCNVDNGGRDELSFWEGGEREAISRSKRGWGGADGKREAL